MLRLPSGQFLLPDPDNLPGHEPFHFLRFRAGAGQEDANPATMAVSGLHCLPNHAKHCRMMRVIESVQLRVLTVNRQRILREIIGTQ